MNPRSVLDHWRDSGELNDAGYRQALLDLGLAPDAGRWRILAERLLLVGGVLCLLAGTLMLFASNWLAWPRLARVGVAEAGWLALLAWAYLAKPQGFAKRWALFAVGTMSGIWLAVIGQAYQTGADVWQLFAVWAALALPWALIAHFVPLWGLWIVIVSVGLQLWLPHAPWRAPISAFSPFEDTNLPLIVFWLAALAAVEWKRAAQAHWSERILPRLLGFGVGVLLTIPACLIAAGEHARAYGERTPGSDALILCVWLASLVAAIWFSLWRRDLFLLALPLFSVWAAVLSGILGRGNSSALLFPVAILAVGGLGGIGWFVHDRHRQWQAPAAKAAVVEVAP
ncbi:DUF2157 domain-containing protein [Andreprevotia chitinilytica]|uniref:DUF2157 domain-containing protein n=1 Tax=Andreprevotia chitinilytica TaxID=396808 RepID=UPI00068A923D|nr:DUF2157 domain-containing protein [Andreprevotia chitinilytica]